MSFSKNTLEDRRLHILEQINLLGQPETSKDNQTIGKLKEAYNEIVQHIYNNTHGVLWDITEVFPPDIWIEIIKQSLPTEGYASALLTLTLVSKKWHQKLVAIPTLWAYIEICADHNDAMATISVFAHLSRNTDLTLSIKLPLFYDSAIFDLILARMAGRIKWISFSYFIPGNEFALSQRPDIVCYQDTDVIIAWPNYLSTVTEIDIAGSQDMGVARLMGILPILPLIKRLSGWCFHTDDFDTMCRIAPHLEEVRTCTSREGFIPCFAGMSQLRSIDINMYGWFHPSHQLMLPARSPLSSSLTRFLFSGHFSARVMVLMSSVAAQLLELELHLPCSGCSDLPHILDHARRLTRLSLTLRYQSIVDQDCTDEVTTLEALNTDHSVPSLRELRWVVSYDVHGADTLKRQLIALFGQLYRMVETAYFWDYTEDPTAYLLDYLPYLQNMKFLSIDFNHQPFILPEQLILQLKPLETLEMKGSNLLNCFEALELQHLKIKIETGHLFQTLKPNSFTRLRSIYIDDYIKRGHTIDIPEDYSMALTRLTLHIHSQRSVFIKRINFSVLTVLSVRANPDTATSTSLCAALLYHPEACPALEIIRFLRSVPDWDILFLMLERRNFREGIARIRRLSLPFIPHHLRVPLCSLLRGFYTTRPPNIELSFAGVIDPYWDNNIIGCQVCVRYMLGPCDHAPSEFNSESFGGKAVPRSTIYSTRDDILPTDLEPHILEWLKQRETFLLDWMVAMRELGPRCWRWSNCKFWDSLLEITEHDFL